ncbi:uncharacterized protein MONOS_11481 [Monocercomonoides exilis]|uniref:uncharacterized protein n=1 Tax=Monocercomonoides exilis TaxID=2049356 RepID=UPI0035595D15|nr:hypothetical protein MONOS_11481 [Monocercomonoides exilis]|eukprot:MONOS_11481.1-p1 / transcript=MONOS_11481.1 / gene=MONOS_11481 / organism=Monocercomonoides_exilis_PA203 / gene_product=unspecified product / transcript_product=unspecified product / location=Mono_scaffold00579:4018-4800(-) / protein_length=180 / sequence_SO=supercontig / SO=protein_coding / is_pseudo=false
MWQGQLSGLIFAQRLWYSLSTTPFLRLRSEVKNAAVDKQLSLLSFNASVIDPLDASEVAVPDTSTAVMDDIERELGLSVSTKSESKWIFAAADVNAFPLISDLFDPSLLTSEIAQSVSRSPQSMCVVVKLDEEVMGQCAATLSKMDGKCEGHVVELGVEKEELGRHIPELRELHEEVKQ